MLSLVDESDLAEFIEEEEPEKDTYLDTGLRWGIVLSEEIRYNFSIVRNGMKRPAAYPPGMRQCFTGSMNIYGRDQP